MNDPLLVGITGGIGSGKSTVAKIFKVLGIPVYDADLRARQLVASDADLRSAIITLLGSEAFLGGTYNRPYVAAKVFREPALLKGLNELIHPAVASDFQNWCETYGESPYLLKEAALLFEAGSYKQLDHVIVVTSPEETRIQRVISRDPGRDREDILKIMENQWAESRKVELADSTISNSQEDLLIPQVLDLHRLFSEN